METTPANTNPVPEESPPPQRAGCRRIVVWSFVALALITCGSCTGCVIIGHNAQQDGEDFLRELAPKLMQPWSSDTLRANAGPWLQSTMPPEKADKFISLLNTRLGNMQKIRQLTPVSYRVYLGTMGLQIVVNYEMIAQFDKADASVRWTIVKQNGKWSVEGFYIGSDALLD